MLIGDVQNFETHLVRQSSAANKLQLWILTPRVRDMEWNIPKQLS